MQRAYSAPYDSISRGSSAGYPANDSYAIRYPDAAGYNQQQLSASRGYSSSSRDPYSASQPMAYDHYGNGGYSHGGYGAEDPYFLHQQSSRSRYFDEYADVGLQVDSRSRDYVYDSRSHRDAGYGVNNGYSDRDRDNYSARAYPGSSSSYIHPVAGSAGIASSATYEYEEGEHPHRSGGGAISGDAQRSRSSAAGRDYYPSGDHYGHGGGISRSTSRSAIDYPDHRNTSYDDGRGRYNNQAQTPGSSSRGVLEPGSGRRGGYDPRMVPSGVSYPGHASSSSYHQDKSGAPTLRTPR